MMTEKIVKHYFASKFYHSTKMYIKMFIIKIVLFSDSDIVEQRSVDAKCLGQRVIFFAL